MTTWTPMFVLIVIVFIVVVFVIYGIQRLLTFDWWVGEKK